MRGRKPSPDPLIFKTVGLTVAQWEWLALWLPLASPTSQLRELFYRALKFWPAGPFVFSKGRKTSSPDLPTLAGSAGLVGDPAECKSTHSERSPVWVIVSPTLTAKSGSTGQDWSLTEYAKSPVEYAKIQGEYSTSRGGI